MAVHPDLITSVKQLEAQLRRLEAESFEKDSVVKGLEKELTEIKAAKEQIQTQISCRDAEIKMQKDLGSIVMKSRPDELQRDPFQIEHDCLRGKWTIQESAGDEPNLHTWTQKNEAAEAEKLVSEIKSGSAALFNRTELLEKNILIYQSHQIFTQLENEYFPLVDPWTNQRIAGNMDSLDTSFSSVDQNGNSTEINNRILHQLLDEVKEANFGLRRRLEEVANHVKCVPSELSVSDKWAQDPVDISRLANYIHGLFEKLEAKRKLFLQEKRNSTSSFKLLQPATTEVLLQPPLPRCISKYTDSNSGRAQGSGETPGKITAMVEIIRLQAEQIQRYESYVSRLHDEIREWVNPGDHFTPATKIFDPDASDSVIDTLRKKIEEDIKRFHAKETRNAELESKLEEMKVRFVESKESEVKFRAENKLLRGIISDLNKIYAKRNPSSSLPSQQLF